MGKRVGLAVDVERAFHHNEHWTRIPWYGSVLKYFYVDYLATGDAEALKTFDGSKHLMNEGFKLHKWHTNSKHKKR